jgi:hypothetical protein
MGSPACSAEAVVESLDPRLQARAKRVLLKGLSSLNAPWHTWPMTTRYAVLGLTAVNLIFALATYFILLKRWL